MFTPNNNQRIDTLNLEIQKEIEDAENGKFSNAFEFLDKVKE